MNKKGQVALYFSFILITLVIIIISALVAPMGVEMASKFYLAGETMMLDANQTISQLSDTSMAENLTNIIGQGTANTQNNIEVFTAIYKYGWIIVIIVIAIGLFLYTRRLVEYGGGGFV
jgi:uncharacterized protein (UPF0333 family)